MYTQQRSSAFNLADGGSTGSWNPECLVTFQLSLRIEIVARANFSQVRQFSDHAPFWIPHFQ
jgi:hypothetical protein